MKLFYRRYGSGPLLIILHGLFGSSDNWTAIAKNLSGIFTVILPDQRNHGQSPHAGIHGYPAMRDDLYELVKDIGADRFFLAGHSMGGKTALSFALKWPEMLQGLLVADISPFKGGDAGGSEYSYHAGILKTIMSVDLQKVTKREEAETEIRQSGLPEKVILFILKNLKRIDENRFEWKLNAPALLKNIDNIMKPMDREQAYSARVSGFPVYFLRGSESDYLPVSDYNDILEIFPAAEFIEIPGAGHWLHADNPEAVIKAFRRFLS